MTSENTVSRRTYKFQNLFLENIQISELHIFNNYIKEKRILEKIMLYFELRKIISNSCVVWSHGSRNNTELIDILKIDF